MSSYAQAFMRGLEVRHAREEKERQVEERKLNLQKLKNEMARLKEQQAVEDFKNKYGIMQGQPGPSVPGVGPETGGVRAQPTLGAIGDMPAFESELPGLPEQNFPHLPIGIPQHLGGGTVTPQTRQEIQADELKQLLQKRQIERMTRPPGERFEPIGTGGTLDLETGQRIDPFVKPETPPAPPAATVPLSPERLEQEKSLRTLGRPDTSRSTLEVWLEQNPGRNVEDFIKLQASARTTARPLPIGVKNDLATFDRLETKLKALDAKVNLNPNWVGSVYSGNPAILRRLSEKRGTMGKDEALFRKEVLQDLNDMIHELSGAAVSPAEAERLLAGLPNLEMSPVEFRAAVNALMNDIRLKRESILNQYGEGSAPTTPQTFVEQPDGTFAPQ